MRFVLPLVLFMAICFGVLAQDSTYVSPTHLPGHFLNKLDSRTASLSKQLSRQTERYVKQMSGYENDLQKKLKDSNAARSLFLSNPQQQYARYLEKLKTDSVVNRHINSGQ